MYQYNTRPVHTLVDKSFALVVFLIVRHVDSKVR